MVEVKPRCFSDGPTNPGGRRVGDELYPRFARDCERAIREGRLSLGEGQSLRRFYESELNGYTYLEPDDAA